MTDQANIPNNLWDDLPRPFIGLSPMDGVTDALFRFIMTEYGKPDLMMTEFTCVEGIAHNALKLLRDFEYDEKERPIIAQVFGTDIESFYSTAVIVCELGFDGIDINMGCPSKNVSGRGAGAGLIRTPELASEIIKAVLLGVQDYSKGIMNLEKLPIKNKMKDAIRSQAKLHSPIEVRSIPVSVKTRIGYDEIIVESWVSHLLQHDIKNITLHGRTLKQMYAGFADWDAISRGAKLAHQAGILLTGNGDVHSRTEALEKVQKYGVDGVLIGRASFGNPWVFQDHESTLEERIQLAVHHCQEFENRFGTEHFFVMRKHLGWYIKGHPNAKEVRTRLMLANSTQEVKEILDFNQSNSQGRAPLQMQE